MIHGHLASNLLDLSTVWQVSELLLGRWCGVAVGRVSDLQFIGRGCESCLGTIAQWPWASYLHLCASVIKQYNFVSAKAGK